VTTVVVSFGEWPYGVVRLGVVLCVGLVFIVIASRYFSDALSGSDYWADQHASFDYTTRSVPPEEAVGSQQVVEDARLWMPDDATYRIVAAPDLQGPLQWAPPGFLAGFLLPRRQTESESTPWIFCYLCNPRGLGPRFEVLSDGGNGVIFGRMRP
jgi:hypothetical protein